MTRRSFGALANALGLSYDDLKRELAAFDADTNPAPLSPEESAHLDARFVAVFQSAQYDDCLSEAHAILRRAEDSKNDKLVANWADRVADAYRASGQLSRAAAYYAAAFGAWQRARQEDPSDRDLSVQAARTRFGMIMVQESLINGSFRNALEQHGHLHQELQWLFSVPGAAPPTSHEALGLLHIQRQQAEMLRYLGRYAEALALIRDVISQYPASALEARLYASLSEADSLRMLGDHAAALTQYSLIEAVARDRQHYGLLGSVLVRKARSLCGRAPSDATTANALRAESLQCINEAVGITKRFPRRYFFMTLYAHLGLASAAGTPVSTGLEQIATAAATFPLSRHYLTLEFAHVTLCRGMLRARAGAAADAQKDFRVAYECYARMECNWGVLRAWLGHNVSGGRLPFPKTAGTRAEGEDQRIDATAAQTYTVQSFASLLSWI